MVHTALESNLQHGRMVGRLPPNSAWRHAQFRQLLVGQVVSNLGDCLTVQTTRAIGPGRHHHALDYMASRSKTLPAASFGKRRARCAWMEPATLL